MQSRRQPLNTAEWRHGSRRAGLQERQADMAEQAAMFRRVVRPVFRDESGGLREQSDCQQQKYKEPPVAVERARYVGRNRHTISL
jgi:hypothetical protein